MADIQASIAAELLRGTHRLVLTFNGKDKVVDGANPHAKLSANGASITIDYDGLHFVISAFAGSVLINNAPAVAGNYLSGSCVIVMGVKNIALNQYPASVTADVSHPEVTL